MRVLKCPFSTCFVAFFMSLGELNISSSQELQQSQPQLLNNRTIKSFVKAYVDDHISKYLI